MAGIQYRWHLLPVPGGESSCGRWVAFTAFQHIPTFGSSGQDWVNFTITACTRGQKCSQALVTSSEGSQPLRQGPQLENLIKSLNACYFLRSRAPIFSAHDCCETLMKKNEWAASRSIFRLKTQVKQSLNACESVFRKNKVEAKEQGLDSGPGAWAMGPGPGAQRLNRTGPGGRWPQGIEQRQGPAENKHPFFLKLRW